MCICNLSLSNYRNFEDFKIEFPTNKTLIFAPNATGKSNLLESIYMFSYPRPIRDISEHDLIRWNFDDGWSRIKGQFQSEGVNESLEIFLQKTSINRTSKTLKVNDVKRKGSDFIGKFFSIFFSPTTLNILILSPSKRRSFLDRLISSLVPDYAFISSEYLKVIKSKNRVLDNIRKGYSNTDELFFWNNQLEELGNRIIKERLSFVEKINEKIKNTLGKKSLKLTYNGKYLKDVQLIVYREIQAGRCLVGPHRDDWKLIDGHRNLSQFGSRGEQRMAMLNFLFSIFYITEEEKELKPVLLLDDVGSELDKSNMKILMDMLKLMDAQTIITTATLKQFEKGSDINIVKLNEFFK